LLGRVVGGRNERLVGGLLLFGVIVYNFREMMLMLMVGVEVSGGRKDGFLILGYVGKGRCVPARCVPVYRRKGNGRARAA
jgi:hypothetical protein